MIQTILLQYILLLMHCQPHTLFHIISWVVSGAGHTPVTQDLKTSFLIVSHTREKERKNIFQCLFMNKHSALLVLLALFSNKQTCLLVRVIHLNKELESYFQNLHILQNTVYEQYKLLPLGGVTWFFRCPLRRCNVVIHMRTM